MSEEELRKDIADQIAVWQEFALANHHKSTRFGKDYWEGYLDALGKCEQVARGTITIHPPENP